MPKYDIFKKLQGILCSLFQQYGGSLRIVSINVADLLAIKKLNYKYTN